VLGISGNCGDRCLASEQSTFRSGHDPEPASPGCDRVHQSQEFPLPRFIAQDGRRGWLALVVTGALLAAPTIVLASLLSHGAAFGFLAILLGMIASVYLGFALQDGRIRVFRIEYVGLVLFAGLATVALSEESAVTLSIGYFGHGLWDAIHHPRAVDTAMPRWYVPLCLSFDAVIALYVLIRFA